MKDVVSTARLDGGDWEGADRSSIFEDFDEFEDSLWLVVSTGDVPGGVELSWFVI